MLHPVLGPTAGTNPMESEDKLKEQSPVGGAAEPLSFEAQVQLQTLLSARFWFVSFFQRLQLWAVVVELWTHSVVRCLHSALGTLAYTISALLYLDMTFL